MKTVFEKLASIGEQNPQRMAILGVDQPGVDYQALVEQVRQTKDWLNRHGLGRNDRIAMVLPNGAEMATCFLSVVCTGTAAPLNPAYRAEEFAFYLEDIQANALIVQKGKGSAAVEEANKLNIPVLELEVGETAGKFTLSGELPEIAEGSHEFVQPGDIALVLHTSGTTARPKLVPLTQANLARSSGNTCEALGLSLEDRCLNVMPLFHVHGLMAGLMATLFSGGSLVCAPGFSGDDFFGWLERFTPTWYTAVPTIHQAVLERARQRQGFQHSLRMIRSCSAPLPPPVMLELEHIFRVPVIEAYGMTEASHQVASNPLPPGKRKPGSVGLPAGPEVAILDDNGTLLARGQVGEICLRGENITMGYENNPTANQKSFNNGWFRTGDHGMLDDEGYVFIQGRLKEIINRGGEKISPREVDDILLGHPAVSQAVTFAAPHSMLGETVAAAVVLKPGMNATPNELRTFVAQHAAYIKIPELVLFLDQLPKGPTGKVQRVGLAQKLGITAVDQMDRIQPEQYVAPANPLEEALTGVWQEVLGEKAIGSMDHFLDLGGDSLKAALLISRINRALDVELTLPEFFAAPTIVQLALLVEKKASTLAD